MALFSHVRLLHLSINVAQICKDAGEPLFLGGLEVLLVFCTLWTGPASHQSMTDMMHTYTHTSHTCQLVWLCRSNINNFTGWHVVSSHITNMQYETYLLKSWSPSTSACRFWWNCDTSAYSTMWLVILVIIAIFIHMSLWRFQRIPTPRFELI